jgi:hypothetical protein
MLKSLDLNTAAEKGLVKGFTLQTRARLSELDSCLPQVVTICEMVERGVGVVSLSGFSDSNTFAFHPPNRSLSNGPLSFSIMEACCRESVRLLRQFGLLILLLIHVSFQRSLSI